MIECSIPGWRTVERCPACGSEYRRAYSSATGTPAAVVDFGGVPIPMTANVAYFRCQFCGLVYHAATPTPETLDQYYGGGVYRQTVADDPAHEAGRAERVVGLLKGWNVNPKRVLDIGCGHGDFLRACAREFGSTIAGVEPLDGYTADGIKTYRNIDLVTDAYDLVSMLHVLEHIIEPKDIIESARELVVNGYLLIEVPAQFPGGNPIAHCTYYEPWVLAQMIDNSHYLSVVEMSVTPLNTTILVDAS